LGINDTTLGCWAADSFNSALKVEFVHRRTIATRAEARLRIATWISDFHNTRTRHSKAGGLPPVEFERLMREARKTYQARYRRQEAASAAPPNPPHFKRLTLGRV